MKLKHFMSALCLGDLLRIMLSAVVMFAMLFITKNFLVSIIISFLIGSTDYFKEGDEKVKSIMRLIADILGVLLASTAYAVYLINSLPK